MASEPIFKCDLCLCLRRLCMLDAIIKDVALRLIGIYAPKDTMQRRPDLFQRNEPNLKTFRRVVLAGNWNAVLDYDLDCMRKIGYENPTVKPF